MAMRRNLFEILVNEPEFPLEAFQLVQHSLGAAQEKLYSQAVPADEQIISGQDLCYAAKELAIAIHGSDARKYLNSIGINSTQDIGRVVSLLCEAGMMRTNESDRQEDFDDVFDFDEVFE